MNYSIKVEANAETDLLEAFLWFEEIQEGLGVRFENDFREAVSQLVRNPYNFQVRYDNTRIVFLKVFLFGIHYRIQGTQVQIASVFHTSRKPRS